MEAKQRVIEECLERLSAPDAPTISSLAKRYGMVYGTLYKRLLSAGYRPGYRQLTPREKRQIDSLLLRTNLSQREIARMVGRAYSTVQLRCSRLRRLAVRGAETEMRIVDRHADCPKHGKISVWPCVACAAEAARRGKQLKVRRRTAAMG